MYHRRSRSWRSVHTRSPNTPVHAPGLLSRHLPSTGHQALLNGLIWPRCLTGRPRCLTGRPALTPAPGPGAAQLEGSAATATGSGRSRGYPAAPWGRQWPHRGNGLRAALSHHDTHLRPRARSAQVRMPAGVHLSYNAPQPPALNPHPHPSPSPSHAQSPRTPHILSPFPSPRRPKSRSPRRPVPTATATAAATIELPPPRHAERRFPLFWRRSGPLPASHWPNPGSTLVPPSAPPSPPSSRYGGVGEGGSVRTNRSFFFFFLQNKYKHVRARGRRPRSVPGAAPPPPGGNNLKGRAVQYLQLWGHREGGGGPPRPQASCSGPGAAVRQSLSLESLLCSPCTLLRCCMARW